MWLAVTILVLAIGTPERTSQQPTSGTSVVPAGFGALRGEVRDVTGAAVPRALVTVTVGSSTAPRMSQMLSDGQGQFAFTYLPLGAAGLQVQMYGFQSLTQPIAIRQGETGFAQIVLKIGGAAEVVEVHPPGRLPVETRTVAPATAPQVAVLAPRPGSRTIADEVDAAALHYRQGRLAEALTSTTRAIDQLRVERAAQVTAAAPPRPGLRTAADYLDDAALQYRQGHPAEAYTLTTRAFDLLRMQQAAQSRADRGLSADVAAPTVPQVDLAFPPIGSAGAPPIRVGGDIVEPKKLLHINPTYPLDALAAGAGGVVILEALISADGTVRDPRILRGISSLNEAALGAVRQWTYRPTMLSGEPVEVVLVVTVKFLPN